jgi:hypothetical protein
LESRVGNNFLLSPPLKFEVDEYSRDANPAQSTINKRLEELQWALETCKFEPEGNNIRAAMIGYQNGSIPYSESVTLIYASQIVDTASAYSEIIRNRSERLDLYFSRHGSCWL